MTGEIVSSTLRMPDEGWDRWEDFCARQNAPLFARRAWSKVLEESHGPGSVLNVLISNKSNLTVGLPGVIRQAGPFSIWLSSLPLGGEVPPSSMEKNLWDSVIATLRSNRVDLAIVISNDAPLRELGKKGGIIEHPRHVLSLEDYDSEESLWLGKAHENVRRNIRRARREGVTVRCANCESDITSFYNLYTMTMGRNRAIVKYPLCLFQTAWRHLHPENCEVYIAEVDGEILGGLFVLRDQTTDYYFMGGSVAGAALKKRPNDALFDFAIRKALRDGKGLFDFMGSPPGDSELMRFKKKWGCRTETTYETRIPIRPLRSRAFDIAYRVAQTGVVRKFLNKKTAPHD